MYRVRYSTFGDVYLSDRHWRSEEDAAAELAEYRSCGYCDWAHVECALPPPPADVRSCP
jgi:hypothetical protein